MTTCKCPKCDGSGYIRAFANIANGVCFTCGGSGTVKARKAPKVRPMTEYQLGFLRQVETADLSTMTFHQLSELRNFSHWHYPQAPHLHATWMERGEQFFQARQEEQLAEFYANR